MTAALEKQKQNKNLMKSKEEFPRASDNLDLEGILLKFTHGKYTQKVMCKCKCNASDMRQPSISLN